MRRLTLSEALEVAGQLFDELHERSARSMDNLNSNLDALRELTMRRLFLDKLTAELDSRKVIPVTLNTLSNLFAQVYSCVL